MALNKWASGLRGFRRPTFWLKARPVWHAVEFEEPPSNRIGVRYINAEARGEEAFEAREQAATTMEAAGAMVAALEGRRCSKRRRNGIGEGGGISSCLECRNRRRRVVLLEARIAISEGDAGGLREALLRRSTEVSSIELGAALPTICAYSHPALFSRYMSRLGIGRAEASRTRTRKVSPESSLQFRLHFRVAV